MTEKQRFLEICRTEIKREGLEKLLDWLEKSDFYEAPASTKYHGNYAGGLLRHSLNVYDCLKRIASHYEEKNISAESIAIAALFHDVCKVNFYQKGYRNVKDEHGKWVQKEIYEINEKFPIGHGEKSCIILQWFFGKLDIHELLAIRYHMGSFDAAVKGGDFGISKAYEMAPLAAMLHLADLEATYLLEEIQTI
ncbi:MAG: HD domain-containing protein [Clostridia bacterium]|nr:HD domain-containing protein [Clostridia bacterium]